MYKRKREDSRSTNLTKHRSKPKNEMAQSQAGYQNLYQQQLQQQQQQRQSSSLSGRIMVSFIAVVFIATFIMTVFHICISYLFHRARRRRIALLLASADQSPNLNDSANRGLDPDLLRSLPITVRSPSDKPIDCSVCLSEIEEGEKMRVLPKCHHEFHAECIDMWFSSRETCPLCRKRVEAETPAACNAGTTSTSVVAMVGIEEPPERIDELGLGLGIRRWRELALKWFLIPDQALYRGTITDADLESGDAVEQDPVSSQSTAQVA